jgi:hypothetical protein
MSKNKKVSDLELGLETATTSNQVATMADNFENKEWLEKNEFEPIEGLTSSKHDTEREPKVQNGLKAINELLGDKINPLLILLAKFWENKTARASIKKMIDAEAAAKNVPADIYLQVQLRENVDKMAEIQSAVDRLRYAITYFKPRPGAGTKAIFKPMRIDGVDYNVNILVLQEAKEMFTDDKEAIKAYVVERSEKMEIEEYL